MDRAIYDAMAAHDSTHWWYVARRAVLRDLIVRRIVPKPGARILEIGCGTGHNLAMLREFAHPNGITVETIADITNTAGKRISSSAIRASLADGRLDDARAMLGQRYAIVGRVTHGKKLGRTLGFPTANVSLTGRKPPLHGVFAVQCRLVTRGLEGVAGEYGVTLNGVANLGSNPVVSFDNRLHLEVFLFDTVNAPNGIGDIYGKRLKVTFIEKIRDELKLESLVALVTQMHDDTAKTKTILLRLDSKDGNA